MSSEAQKITDIHEPQELARREMEATIARSRAAQEEIAHYTQEQVNALISAMVYAVSREDRAEEIAQFTVEETRLGNYTGKIPKDSPQDPRRPDGHH